MLPAFLSALVWAIDPGASRVDVSGGVAAEVRGGVAPIDAASEPEPSVLTIVTPNLDFMARHRRHGIWVLGYSPRVQYRTPNRLSVERPLLLHQAYTTYEAAIDRLWDFRLDVSGSYGELDYTTLNLLLGDQATPTDADVTQFGVVNGSMTFMGVLDRKNTLSVVPSLTHRRPVENFDPDVGRSLQIQTVAMLTLAFGHQATALDTVSVAATPQFIDNADQVRWVGGEGRVAWTRALGPGVEARLDGGLFGIHRLWVSEDSEAVNDSPTRLFPVGGVEINGRLVSTADYWLDGSVGAGIDTFIDRVRDAVDPRASVRVDVTATVPPRWSVGLTFSAFTPVTEEPRTLGDGPAINETLLRAQTPVTYDFNEQTAFEFGTVWGVRAPHFAAENRELSQFEFWAYVAVRWGIGTARGRAEIRQEETQIGTGIRGVGADSGGR